MTDQDKPTTVVERHNSVKPRSPVETIRHADLVIIIHDDGRVTVTKDRQGRELKRVEVARLPEDIRYAVEDANA